MNIVCLDEVKVLTEKREGAHVSLFMPTHQVGGASKEDVIRFKNLVSKAETGLAARGLRVPQIKEILGPAEKLIQDNLFWRRQSDGLAIFLAPGFYLYYNVPLVLEEMVAVADRFQIKPLIPLLGGCNSFYLLALAQNDVKLLQATKYGSAEVALPAETPKSLPEATKYTEVPGKQVRYHSASSSNIGGEAAIYHGAGLAPNYDKDVLLHFFNQVNKGVYQIINREKAPLVLMGVDYLLPLYRKANTYQYLLSEGITGNPESLSNDQLREKAWGLVQSSFNKAESDALGQYRASAGTGHTSSDIKEVVTAARAGMVRFLFVAGGVQQWGSFSPDGNELVLHKQQAQGDEDLLELASVQTFINGGAVYIMDPKTMPDDAQVAAVFRN